MSHGASKAPATTIAMMTRPATASGRFSKRRHTPARTFTGMACGAASSGAIGPLILALSCHSCDDAAAPSASALPPRRRGLLPPVSRAQPIARARSVKRGEQSEGRHLAGCGCAASVQRKQIGTAGDPWGPLGTGALARPPTLEPLRCLNSHKVSDFGDIGDRRKRASAFWRNTVAGASHHVPRT